MSLCSIMFVYCIIVNTNCVGTYIDSPDWIKTKKTTANPINKKNNNRFQYAVTVTLNHKEIKKDSQRITKKKPFINKYNWEGTNSPSKKNNDRKKFEKKNVILLLLFCMLKKKKYILLHVSKYNSNCEKQVIFLMNSDRKGWHYLAVKNY